MSRIKAMNTEFIMTKFDGLDGRTKVQWATDDGSLKFQADELGIYINGKMEFKNQADLQGFAKFLGESVWHQHMRLKPKILKPGEQ